MLGELPGGNLRAYYKFENVNDSSGNGYTLTNNNSVSFANQGKFKNGADFGSSGTNKSLTVASNVLNGNPNNFTFSFWFKLNNTTSTGASVGRFFTHTSNTGPNCVLQYRFSAGNLIIEGSLGSTLSSITVTPDTNWHHLRIVRVSTSHFIMLDNKLSSNALVGSNGALNGLDIGNNAARTAGGWVMMDEFWVKDYSVPAGEVQRYYTQAKGRFCI